MKILPWNKEKELKKLYESYPPRKDGLREGIQLLLEDSDGRDDFEYFKKAYIRQWTPPEMPRPAEKVKQEIKQLETLKGWTKALLEELPPNDVNPQYFNGSWEYFEIMTPDGLVKFTDPAQTFKFLIDSLKKTNDLPYFNRLEVEYRKMYQKISEATNGLLSTVKANIQMSHDRRLNKQISDIDSRIKILERQLWEITGGKIKAEIEDLKKTRKEMLKNGK